MYLVIARLFFFDHISMHDMKTWKGTKTEMNLEENKQSIRSEALVADT